MENSWFVPLLGGPLDGIMQPLAMPPAEQSIAERVLRFENSLRGIWACRKRLPLGPAAEEEVAVYELRKTSSRWEYQFVGYDSREASNTELIRPELMSPFGLE
jgi:hypothetical protein